MTHRRSSAKETANPTHASDLRLLLETSIGLLLPGLAFILEPSVFLATEQPAAMALLYTSALFAMSIHLGLQDSPAYGRLAPLVCGPLALAPFLLAAPMSTMPMPAGLLALLPTVVYARAAHHAWKHLRQGTVTVG